jgi:hypothetical protein
MESDRTTLFRRIASLFTLVHSPQLKTADAAAGAVSLKFLCVLQG